MCLPLLAKNPIEDEGEGENRERWKVKWNANGYDPTLPFP